MLLHLLSHKQPVCGDLSGSVEVARVAVRRVNTHALGAYPSPLPTAREGLKRLCQQGNPLLLLPSHCLSSWAATRKGAQKASW